MIPVPCIVGPTGVGKTEIGIAVAEQLNFEIISADSRQIYKYMDIGTAKPKKNGFRRFHMLDIVTPDQIYSAGDYARDAQTIIEELERAKKRSVVVGGSGLYIRALFEPFATLPKDSAVRAELKKEPQATLYGKLAAIDPASTARIHPHDNQRTVRALEVYALTGVPLSSHLNRKTESFLIPDYIGIDMPRKELYARIENRFDAMVQSGFLEEIKSLKALGYSRDLYAFNALGYRELFDFIEGSLPFEQAVRRAKHKTKEYAKRQLSWFRHLDGITWIEHTDQDTTAEKVVQLLRE